MSGMVGWSSGYQSAGPYRLAIWARVNVALDPGRVCCTVLSGGTGAAGAAGGGIGVGGGPAKAEGPRGGATGGPGAPGRPAPVRDGQSGGGEQKLFFLFPLLLFF